MPSPPKSITISLTLNLSITIFLLLLQPLPMTSDQSLLEKITSNFRQEHKALKPHLTDFCDSSKGLWSDVDIQKVFLLRLMHVYGQRYRKEVQTYLQEFPGVYISPPKGGDLYADWTYEVVSQLCSKKPFYFNQKNIYDMWKENKKTLTSEEFYLDLSSNVIIAEEPLQKLIKKFENEKEVPLGKVIAVLVEKHDAKKGTQMERYKMLNMEFLKVRLLLLKLVIEEIESMFERLIDSADREITAFQNKHKDQVNQLFLKLLMRVEMFRNMTQENAQNVAGKINFFLDQTNLQGNNPVTVEEVQKAEEEYDTTVRRKLRTIRLAGSYVSAVVMKADLYLNRNVVDISFEEYINVLAKCILFEKIIKTTRKKLFYQVVFVYAVVLQTEAIESLLKPTEDEISDSEESEKTEDENENEDEETTLKPTEAVKSLTLPINAQGILSKRTEATASPESSQTTSSKRTKVTASPESFQTTSSKPKKRRGKYLCRAVFLLGLLGPVALVTWFFSNKNDTGFKSDQEHTTESPLFIFPFAQVLVIIGLLVSFLLAIILYYRFFKIQTPEYYSDKLGDTHLQTSKSQKKTMKRGSPQGKILKDGKVHNTKKRKLSKKKAKLQSSEVPSKVSSPRSPSSLATSLATTLPSPVSLQAASSVNSLGHHHDQSSANLKIAKKQPTTTPTTLNSSATPVVNSAFPNVKKRK